MCKNKEKNNSQNIGYKNNVIWNDSPKIAGMTNNVGNLSKDKAGRQAELGDGYQRNIINVIELLNCFYYIIQIIF